MEKWLLSYVLGFRPLKWRLGSLRLNVRLRGRGRFGKPCKRAPSAQADVQPKASEPPLQWSELKHKRYANEKKNALSH